MDKGIYFISGTDCSKSEYDSHSRHNYTGRYVTNTLGNEVVRSTVAGEEQKGKSFAFCFPSFDELFEGASGGIYLLTKQHSNKDEPKNTDAISDESNTREVDSASPPPPTTTLKKQDSIMQQDFKTTLYNSWEGSTDFFNFRVRFGGAMYHKYFSCCRVDDTHFLGVYVVFGLALVCTGVVGISHCQTNLELNIYLTVDGLLSVFLFPVLLMDWTARVGGCVNEPDKVGRGKFWYCMLLARISLSILGTVMMLYINRPPSVIGACVFGYHVAIATVILEWIFLFVIIFIPFFLLGVLFFIAPKYSSHLKFVYKGTNNYNSEKF